MTTTKPRAGTHPTESDLADFLAGSLPGERRKRVEAHIAACDECLAAAVSAYEAAGPRQGKAGFIPPPKTPPFQGVDRRGGISPGRMETPGISPVSFIKKAGSIMKKINIYLLLAALSFALSFFTHRYFIQMLVATLLLGIKWIVDSKSTRMLVMIYEAWKHGGEKEASRVLERIGQQDKMRF